MKPIAELSLGYSDAENYQRRENKDLFNSVFVKNEYLEDLLDPSTFFLIGEKGTGKTAYAVYIANNRYKNTTGQLKYIRETDYVKFVTMKKQEQLDLSDYSAIWKVILLLLLAKDIRGEELSENPFSKTMKMRRLMGVVDDYYQNAFAPEIVNALEFVKDSKISAELVAEALRLGATKSTSTTKNESRFQVNLLFVQRQFEDALRGLKLKNNHVLMIDGIDIRPGKISYEDYLDCIKGLADASWSLNNDYFPSIRDSDGRLRVVLLLRPDIFNSLGFQNASNKVRDNSVLLDWRTTYPSYRSSMLFALADRLLASQQTEFLEKGTAWDHYLPFVIDADNPNRPTDNPFIFFLRYSYSRPRDIVTMLSILRDETRAKLPGAPTTFSKQCLESNDFKSSHSTYLMGGIRDQLAFYYSEDDYETFLKFFTFLDSSWEFSFGSYRDVFSRFKLTSVDHLEAPPEFLGSEGDFLQFLYDTNVLCYKEVDENDKPLFRWCYRERSSANISPKVKLDAEYRIHYGLLKSLNLRRRKLR